NLGRIAEVFLEPAPPGSAVSVPVQAALVCPVQQVTCRGHQGVRMTCVHNRGVAAGRQNAGANLTITLDRSRHRDAGLELHLIFHIDDDIPPERWARWSDATSGQPLKDLTCQWGDDRAQLLHAHSDRDRRVGLIHPGPDSRIVTHQQTPFPLDWTSLVLGPPWDSEFIAGSRAAVWMNKRAASLADDRHSQS